MALTRDTQNAMIFGVCAGMAKEWNSDVTVCRILTVISFFFTGSLTFWAYIIMAILLPKS